MNTGRKLIRYSEAFKLKVVSELESGKFTTVGQAQKIYDITGADTIPKWIRKYGKNHLLRKVVRVETKDEKDRIKELEKEKKDLEAALAKSQVELMYKSADVNFYKSIIGKEKAEKLKKNAKLDISKKQ